MSNRFLSNEAQFPQLGIIPYDRRISRLITSVYNRHVALGGRIVDFAGWELPVQYPEGIVAEHKATREQAGLFDVSHMGEILVTGPDALPYLQHLLTNSLSRLSAGRAVYSPMCYEDGGTVDDLIVYPYGADYLVVVNASNTDKDFSHFRAHMGVYDVTVDNVSPQWAQLALQGPQAGTILSKLDGGEAIAALPFFGCGSFALLGLPVFAAATGYTGEPGAEIYLPWDAAGQLWDALLAAGAKPCGLGARDTLRLESALPLYGHELSPDITPLEAGLARFVKFDHDFVGRDALRRCQEQGVPRKLIGLVMNGRAIPRAGYPVLCNGTECGVVTSGGVAPSLGQNIALALVASDTPENGLSVMIRNRPEPAAATALPFYKSKK